MISHCLNIQEYKEVLNVNFYNNKQTSDLEYIQEIFESCFYWENKVIGPNYFFSLALEGYQKSMAITPKVIDFIYDLQEKANFEVQEVPHSFIESLYESSYSDGMSIEEKIIEIQNLIDG